MESNRDNLRYAVQELLNEVIEQGFHHLINHPQNSDELNRIIKEATDELNYQLLRIDSHSFRKDSQEVKAHYQQVSKDSQRKSLELLGKLQQVQQRDVPRLRRV
jgi:arsenate reductase-like glutaredoxin family protein